MMASATITQNLVDRHKRSTEQGEAELERQREERAAIVGRMLVADLAGEYDGDLDVAVEIIDGFMDDTGQPADAIERLRGAVAELIAYHAQARQAWRAPADLRSTAIAADRLLKQVAPTLRQICNHFCDSPAQYDRERDRAVLALRRAWGDTFTDSVAAALPISEREAAAAPPVARVVAALIELGESALALHPNIARHRGLEVSHVEPLREALPKLEAAGDTSGTTTTTKRRRAVARTDPDVDS